MIDDELPPRPSAPPSSPFAESTRHAIPTAPRLPYGQIAAATLIVLGILGVALVIVELTRFFMLVFAAVVIGAIFDTIASFLCRRLKLGRGIALTLSVISLVAIIAAAFTLFGSQLAGQIDTIQQSIPGAVTNVEAFLDRFGWGEKARELTSISSNDISRILSQAGGYALAAGSSLADLVLVLVGAIFLASDPATYRRGLLLLLPKPAVKTGELAMDDISHGLRGWMLGQSVSSLVIVAFTWAGLELLGVPAAAGLGLLAGLLDVIPMIGPIIAGLPAVLLAFTVSPMTALWTLLLYLLIQQLQGNFLQPMIQKQAVNVPPAVLLFAVIAAGLLFGMMGVLLAAPLTVVVFVLVQRVYVQSLLGKDIDVAGRK
jgi:predicted PurR-regulated permease PerM